MKSSCRSSKPVTRIAFAVAASMIAAAPANALPRKLPPIDQCSTDPSFVTFREALRGAAKRGDSKAFVAMFAPEAKAPTGYGGEVDPNDVIPAESWIMLETVLRMGCVRSGDKAIMPSVSHQLRRYRSASLKDKVVALDGAEMFDPMQEERKVLGTLAWDVATTTISGDFWSGIRLADGRTGFVSDSDLYPLEPDYGYEIRFEKRQGRWMITDFWK